MSVFEDRERAYEAGYAREQEREFRAQARRDKALGLWMGEKLGLSGEALENYVLSVWRADLKEPGDQDVFAKLMRDSDAHKLGLTEPELRAKMQEALAQARTETGGEG